MKINPVKDTRALEINTEKEKIIAVGDLHIGISAELSEKGIEIPEQTPRIFERLSNLIEKRKPDRLLLLGDIKHNVPVTSWQEWESLPPFFSDLSQRVKVEIVPGNHDGDIEGLLSKGVILHEASGATVGDGSLGFFHGHAWPAPELMKAETIVMGHNHPQIEIRDELGARSTEPAWLRTKLMPKHLPEELKKEVEEDGPEVIVVPAFSELVGGGSINRKVPDKLLGPMFESGAVDLDGADIYLLDGTFLGKLENLRDLAESS